MRFVSIIFCKKFKNSFIFFLCQNYWMIITFSIKKLFLNFIIPKLKGVFSCSSLMLILALFFISSFSIFIRSWCLLWTTECNDVSPSLFWALILAPLLINNSTIPSKPFFEAKFNKLILTKVIIPSNSYLIPLCRGVSPKLSFKFKSAPYSIKSLATSLWPSSEAINAKRCVLKRKPKIDS